MLQNPARFMRAFLRLLDLTNVSVPLSYFLEVFVVYQFFVRG